MTTAQRWSFAALGVILLVACALRAAQLRESLWLDELHTAWVVDGGLREIPPRAAIGNQSPLYFALPGISTRMLGFHEAALRLPSIVAGLAVIVAIYALVRQMTSSQAGALLAAWLAAIDPNFLYYSLEARPYAWVQFVGVLQVFAFWQTLTQPTPWRRGTLVGLSALLFYLHYTAALLVAAETAYYVLAKRLFRGSVKFSVLAAACDLAIVIGLCLPAAAHLQAIAVRREAWWQFVPREPALSSMLTLFPLGPTVGISLLAAAVCRAAGRRRMMSTKPDLPYEPLLLALLWLFVPLLLAYAATVCQLAPLWMRRYVIVGAAAPIVLAGVLCAAAGTRAQRIAAVLLVAAVATWWIGPQWQFQRDGRWVQRSSQDWRAAVAEINGDAAAADWPVLVRSGLIEADALSSSSAAALRAYCLSPVTSIYRLEPARRRLVPLAFSQPRQMPASDVEGLTASGGVWLVTPGNAKTKDATLAGVRHSLRLRPHETRVASARWLGGVWVVKLEILRSRSGPPAS